MSDDKRHRHVVNIADGEAVERQTGTRFGFKAKILAERAGARSIGASWYEIPPGRTAFPYHFHCINEEGMFVLEGEGTLRIGGETVAIRAGDWVSFPVGPDAAHQVTNSGAAPLRLLALSTKMNADVVGYPDSKKIGASAAAPGSHFGGPSWIRVVVPETAGVDYFKDEKVD